MKKEQRTERLPSCRISPTTLAQIDELRDDFAPANWHLNMSLNQYHLFAIDLAAHNHWLTDNKRVKSRADVIDYAISFLFNRWHRINRAENDAAYLQNLNAEIERTKQRLQALTAEAERVKNKINNKNQPNLL